MKVVTFDSRRNREREPVTHALSDWSGKWTGTRRTLCGRTVYGDEWTAAEGPPRLVECGNCRATMLNEGLI